MLVCAICHYLRQFVGRSETISDRLYSCSGQQVYVGCVFRLVDDLIEQFFGLLLTSSMKAVQLKRRTVTAVSSSNMTVLSVCQNCHITTTAVCTASDNDLTGLLLNCFIRYDTIRDAILTCARKPT